MKDKILSLRIFTDEFEKMNLSLLDVMGRLVLVSQFTLYKKHKKSRIPSYDMATQFDMLRIFLIIF